MPKAEVNGQGNHGCHGNSKLKFWLFTVMNFIFEIMKIGIITLLLYQTTYIIYDHYLAILLGRSQSLLSKKVKELCDRISVSMAIFHMYCKGSLLSAINSHIRSKKFCSGIRIYKFHCYSVTHLHLYLYVEK